jgi:hypothetical protein
MSITINLTDDQVATLEKYRNSIGQPSALLAQLYTAPGQEKGTAKVCVVVGCDLTVTQNLIKRIKETEKRVAAELTQGTMDLAGGE